MLEEAAALGRKEDYDGSVAAFRRALALKPNDPAAMYSLGRMQMKADDNRGARKTFAQLVTTDVGQADLHFVQFGHYQLGKIHQLEGRMARAVESFEKMLEFPDRSNAHRMAREAIAAATGAAAP